MMGRNDRTKLMSSPCNQNQKKCIFNSILTDTPQKKKKTGKNESPSLVNSRILNYKPK